MLVYRNFLLIFAVFLATFTKIYAQLGFCSGNSGDAIFTETFGTGTTISALPPGTTTYNYTTTDPQDGYYLVSSNTGYYDWHNTTDHTLGDTNGKCLIVNADFTSGEFYRTTINGLCEFTTYEFSAWLLNLLPNYGCGGNGIPINVRFEIWDVTDTSLLASGDTGNIYGTNTPIWNPYGLVFQTLAGQSAVLLKMLNNGVGGCGNDLAIDDIVFKSCGDLITVLDANTNSNTSICSTETPYTLQLNAIPDYSVFTTHFFQWQESTDGINWINIPGETNQNITLSVTTSTYFRTKVAEYAANVNNEDCLTYSDEYYLEVNQLPTPPNLACWESATINTTTCSWDVSGTQPPAPTVACWETATFNTTSCSWEVSGTQPPAPTNLDCWETATFNTASCSWEVSGTQPPAPTNLDCWETATFNDITCLWEVNGIQPLEPTVACWETTIFNADSCEWEVFGEQPIENQEVYINLCPNNTEVLAPDTNMLNPSYSWNTGASSNSISIDSAGTYSVEISDGCSTTIFTYYVEAVSTPILESVYSEGNTIVVTTVNSGDFEYAINDSEYQLSALFTVYQGGIYTIYVKDIFNCETVSTTYLHFKIPTFFTPNGDLYHETFTIEGLEYFDSSEVFIFNRYGKLLKSAKNSSFNWDGTYNNEKMPTDDYWYVVKVNQQTYTGHFTLRR